MATICTDAFFPVGKAEGEILGIQGLPIAAIPHPMANRSREEVNVIAEGALPEIIHILTTDRKQLQSEYKDTIVQTEKKPSPTRKMLFKDGISIAAEEKRIKAPDSLDAVNRIFYDHGLTDGLPIIPPTSERVEQMIARCEWDPETLIGRIPPKDGEATVEKIAANATMAGCLPEYLSVVIAAAQAMIQPRFNLNALQATTHPVTVLIFINGPLSDALDLNYSYNAMGQGNLGNATIGRAIRLLLINVGGASPGELDRATLGSPAKYTFCFAENERENPWEPFHVERGFSQTVSTVTVIGAEGPHNVNDHGGKSAEEVLITIAGSLATPGTNNIYLGGEPMVVLGPEHASIIARDGFSKKDVKAFLYEHARLPLSGISNGNKKQFKKNNPERFSGLKDTDRVPLVEDPDEFMIVVAGGKGRHSVIIPTFGGHTRAVTVAVTDKTGEPIIPEFEV